MSDYETILVEQRGAVTLVTLNRPQALNALNSGVLRDLIAAFAAYDADESKRCLILTGSEKAFAAGADIKLGVTPGMGGSQRLTLAIGKAKAMEMCLTGRMMGAEEAERAGLVAKVVPAAELLDEAMKTAEAIAAMAPLAAIATKEMVNATFELSLAQGIAFERRLFHGLFGTADQKEGMVAFVEKRPGKWTGR
jgi:enoyl-CoA hydratase